MLSTQRSRRFAGAGFLVVAGLLGPVSADLDQLAAAPDAVIKVQNACGSGGGTCEFSPYQICTDGTVKYLDHICLEGCGGPIDG
ncbi:MAG: hypothetical protein HY703_06705 [Gemmatimonadetes bacterium]|nr:hypothetical protein [Gemmatimonadota bacterium]